MLLKQLRKQKNYTQAQVAAKLNVSSTTVSLWENNQKKPLTEHIIGLSELYNEPLSIFVGKKPKKCVEIDKLTDNQQTILRLLVEEMHHKDCIKQNLTKRQHDILSALFDEFIRFN